MYDSLASFLSTLSLFLLSSLSTFVTSLLFGTLGHQKLDKWNLTLKKSSLEELALILLILSIQDQSPIFFSPSHRQKQTYDKTFDINYLLFTRNHNTKEIDLSFVDCQFLPKIKVYQE